MASATPEQERQKDEAIRIMSEGISKFYAGFKKAKAYADLGGMVTGISYWNEPVNCLMDDAMQLAFGDDYYAKEQELKEIFRSAAEEQADG